MKKTKFKPLKSESVDYGFVEDDNSRIGEYHIMYVNGEWKLGVVEPDMVRIIEN